MKRTVGLSLGMSFIMLARLVMYPLLCAVQAYILTKNKEDKDYEKEVIYHGCRL